MKPRVSDVYTANMGGVDRADQLRSHYYVGRQSRKWYKYLFWFSFNLAACNAYILESEAEKGQSKNILQIQKNILNRNIFLKSLSKSLTNLKNYCKS